MKCPYCESAEYQSISDMFDSFEYWLPNGQKASTRSRHQCLRCGRTWTVYGLKDKFDIRRSKRRTL